MEWLVAFMLKHKEGIKIFKMILQNRAVQEFIRKRLILQGIWPKPGHVFSIDFINQQGANICHYEYPYNVSLTDSMQFFVKLNFNLRPVQGILIEGISLFYPINVIDANSFPMHRSIAINNQESQLDSFNQFSTPFELKSSTNFKLSHNFRIQNSHIPTTEFEYKQFLLAIQFSLPNLPYCFKYLVKGALSPGGCVTTDSITIELVVSS